MNKIVISGGISAWGYSANWLRNELSKISGNVEVFISSYGGDVYESIDMYNLLKEYDLNKGEVTTVVGAKAMSGGAILTMAGRKRVAHANSTFMIHRAWTFALGNAIDLENESKILKGIDKIQAKEFAKCLDETEEEILEMFTTDTYYIGKEELLSTNIFNEIIEEASSDEEIIESKKQASKAFAKSKKEFQVEVEEKSYVPDFAKVAYSIEKYTKEENPLATMPSPTPSADVKIAQKNSKQGDGSMEFNEDNFKTLQIQLKDTEAKLTQAQADGGKTVEQLNTANSTIESLNARGDENKEIVAMAFELNVSKETAMDMISADSKADAALVAADSAKSNGATFNVAKGNEPQEKKAWGRVKKMEAK